jgi:hypothetical protein
MAKDKLEFAGPDEIPVYEAGRYFRVLDADYPVTVRFLGADSGGPELEVDPGIGVPVPGGFDWLLVRSEKAQTVRYTVWDEPVDDNRRTGQVVSLKAATAMATPADVTVSAGTSGQVVAANAARRSLTVQADHGNTDPVRIGGAGVGASAGLVVQPGQSLTLDGWDAAPEVHAYAVNADATVHVMEVTD